MILTLKECILIRNDCYRAAANQNATMTGIVVHDTGAGNPYLKRYIQPLKQQGCYDEVLADLGVNTYLNDWNRSYANGETDRLACVHAFIGKNAKDEIVTYQTLPYDICCWGVGNGSKGSYNYKPNARIQFEICDDGYKSEEYFRAAMKEAQEYCAYLCARFGWDASRICSHHESYLAGYGGNHSDCDGWLAKFGKDMDWFRAEVQKLIDSGKGEKLMEQRIEALEKRVSELEAGREKVYHYYSELPDWARGTITNLHKAGIFVGNGAGDMNLPENLMRTLVILHSAGVLKSNK